jgi:hypothetical protein
MKYTNEYLAEEEIALTTKDSKILIDILREGKDDLSSRRATYNKNCPPEMLVEVLKRGKNDGVSHCAAYNPNCPTEILVEILKKGKNDEVSCNAAYNQNCPDEARINWMMKTGRIGKEDPSVHIIEYEKNKEDDFQDLKDLL